MPEESLRALLSKLKVDSTERTRGRLLYHMYPEEGQLSRHAYPQHMEFFRHGALHNERLFIAGNRTGKTYCVCYEATCHMIGWYPEWWEGRRFDRPVVCWASGEDVKAVRESLQPKLIGTMEEKGTGLIPRDNIVDAMARSGVSGAADYAVIRHSSGGFSRLSFKSYDQGRESFQASEVDVVVLDEEPPLPIYTESLTRTIATVPGQKNGIIMVAFTPLRGLSETVLQFLPGGAYPATPEARMKAWGW